MSKNAFEVDAQKHSADVFILYFFEMAKQRLKVEYNL